ncbi:MAG: GMC family oxidoreductase [Bacteroidota bacterium]
MHTDARTLDDHSVIEGDICIVGAGAAGISMALEWANTAYNVILLEGGGFNVESDIQNLYAGESVGQRYFPLQSARLHFFGGTTGHWAGWSAPYDPQDFAYRPWIPHSGWPISRNDLDPYYNRASEIVELQKYSFDIDAYIGNDPELVKLPFEDSPVWTKMWQLSPPTRFGKKYRQAIVDSPNIHLYTHANVCNIEANESVSAVKQVEIRDLNGKSHAVRARRFVLACGAMQNARLLLASNKQATAGLGNTNDLVGRYFMEHLEVDSARFLLPNPGPMKLYTVDLFISKFFGELSLTAEKQEALKSLNCTGSLRPVPLSESPLSIERYPEDAAETIRMFESLEIQAASGNSMLIDHSKIKVYSMHTRLEQAPNPNSRIGLSQDKDALGVPRTKLDWQLTKLDKHSIRSFYETVGEEAGRLGIGRVQLNDWLLSDDPMWPRHLAGGWHHMGTTRMHTDPKQGVVDSNCQVHGIQNLYMAGSSAFTTAGAANPTLTVIALSLRLSDYLKQIIDKN